MKKSKIAALTCAAALLVPIGMTHSASAAVVGEEGGVKTSTRALAYGPIYQYPASGGTWQYGFWNARVRSYYTVNKCHGSTVKLDGRVSRSPDTRAGATSIAHLWAVQYPWANDEYYYRTC